MVVRRIMKEGWCAVCDSQLAEVEISHEGSLRPVLFNSDDGEICLCRDCFGKLKRMINDFKFEEETKNAK